MKNKANDVLLQIEDEKLGKTDVKLSNLKCKKSAGTDGKNIFFNVQISGDMILGEIEKGTQNKLSKDDYTRLCTLAEKACSKTVSKAFNACVNAKSDALRVGKYIARDCPTYYEDYSKDFDKNFQNVKLNVASHIKLEKISDNSQLE